MKIVIIGGGISAIYIANILAHKEYQVTILSKEKYKPYDRIHLCTLIDNSNTLEDISLEIHPNVTLTLNEEVLDIYPTTKTILCKNNSYAYDKLIIATGSKPKSLFNLSAIKNICTFRSADDAYKIRNGIKNKNVILVGVGPIGLELLDTLSKMDVANSIHILSRGDHLYSKDLDISSVQLMNNIFERNPKVKVSFRDEIIDTTIENNTIITVTTKKRTIDKPFIIFGVGIEPNIDFAKGSIETNKGVLVNDFMQSNDENI